MDRLHFLDFRRPGPAGGSESTWTSGVGGQSPRGPPNNSAARPLDRLARSGSLLAFLPTRLALGGPPGGRDEVAEANRNCLSVNL